MNWYILYTRPNWETKVAKLLLREQIESYCPLIKVKMKCPQLTNKVLKVPLFKSYVFVHVSGPSHKIIKKSDGILNYMYWLNKPAIIETKEIENIKTFLEANPNMLLQDFETKVKTNEVHFFGGKRLLQIMDNVLILKLPSLGSVIVAQGGLLRVDRISNWNTKNNKEISEVSDRLDIDNTLSKGIFS